MNLLSLYAKQFNIRPVIMTDSKVIYQLAQSLHFSFIPQTEVNKYGMPIIRSILIETRRLYKAKQYIYINSDILLNPGIFSVSILLNPGIFSVSKYFDDYFHNENVFLNDLIDNSIL